MGKNRCFLAILASLVIGIFAGTGAHAAYDNCSIQYTSCNSGYYMSGSGAGNSCNACSSANNTTSTQSCTRSCSISNGTCSYSGSTQKCNGKYTGGAGGTSGVSACTGCSSYGECTGGTISISCNASYELSGSSCVACGTGEYSTKGSNSCSACTNKPANSHYTGNGTSNNCSWACDSGYHEEGGSCVPDCSTSKACSSLGAGWQGTYNECTQNQGSQCYKACSAKCSGNNTSACPANASCTYNTSYTYSGTQYYGGSCNAGGSCPVSTISCNSGYYKNGSSCIGCSTVSASGDIVDSTSITGGDRITECTGNHTGGAGGSSGSGSCTGCSSTRTYCECDSGYHVVGSGSSCYCALDCSTSVACPSGYPGTYNECDGEDETDCSRTCSTPCSGRASCPANASCSYNTSYTTSGTQYYGSSCDARAVACPVSSFTCNPAYQKSGSSCTTCSYNETSGACSCSGGTHPNGSGSCVSCSKSCASVSGYTQGTYNACDGETNNQCYRACVASDIANATSVTGTVTKGGVKTCKATMCADGYFVSGSGCKVCPANSGACGESSDPDGFTCNPGYHKDGDSCVPDEYSIALNKNGGTGNIAASVTCRHGENCQLPASGLTRANYDFTGWGTESTCTQGVYSKVFTSATTMYACWSQNTEKCQVGKYYNGSTHVACPKGSYCTGEGSTNAGTAGCSQACPNSGTTDGTGASAITSCYITCSGKTITGGTLTADSAKEYYSGSAYGTCTYTADCDPGYVAQNNGTASATCRVCTAGENCPGGTDDSEPDDCPEGEYCGPGEEPQACPEGGTSDVGAGSITECYKTCPSTISVDHASSVKSDGHAYHDGTSGYKACTYTVTCESGYEAQGNGTASPKCVWADPDACPPGSYCPPEEEEPLSCPEGGTSDGGATEVADCYRACSGTSTTGGTLAPVNAKEYYTGGAYPACKYNATCQAGYMAVGNGTASAKCEPCEDGDYCPAGTTEDDEPEECPPDQVCEGGEEPVACPDGGKTDGGAGSVTECYKTCPATITVENASSVKSDGNAYHNGTTGYKECTYTVTCAEGYSPRNNGSANPTCVWGDASECPEGFYCPPDSDTPIACPEGGDSDKGTTTETECFKEFDPYSGFEKGTASAKCKWDAGEKDYIRCSIVNVHTCDAGYYYGQQNAFSCIDPGSGYYSPAGDVDRTACPTDANGGRVQSSPNAESYSDCYTTCDLSKEDVANSTTVAAAQNTVSATSETAYQACSYSVTCETGYTVGGNNTANPSCNANEYTITLNKNGGTGSVPETMQCTFNSGKCELPKTDALTRPGYSTQDNKWCTGRDGTGSCYYGGQNTGVNISEDGTAVTLYAVWVPNVYTVNLDHQNADTDGAPGTVYLKYATGWFSNQGATTPIAKLTTVPVRAGYEFAGYYNATTAGTQVIGTDGTFITSENALTMTTKEPTTIYARWATGTITCEEGTYYPGTGAECLPCEDGKYCPGGEYETDSGEQGGLESCPDDGIAGEDATSMAACYKTGLDYTAEHGSGTQTCDYDVDSRTYSAKCRDFKIDACNAGYWRQGESDKDCTAVGQGWYSGANTVARTQCPNGGNTETETATQVQDCYKTGVDYTANYGSGTQRCFYTSGEGTSAIYQRDCDTKKIDECRGGYYLAGQDDTDCTEVGNNYYSPQSDTERYACPAGGETGEDMKTADTPKVCKRDGEPYTGAHGTGERTCFYTSGEGDDAIYLSSCENVTMTKCDAGYYYSISLKDDCTAVGKGWYSPADDLSRYQCVDGGTTENATSASESMCYRTDMACPVDNGTGEQTCNYDESAGDYTANCQQCMVTACDEGYSLVDNTCTLCPEGSVCDEGEEKTCADLTGGQYPNSEIGTEDVSMCYRDCALAPNASVMTGHDYYTAPDTCAIQRCAAGYTLENGACVECPEGSFCDGETDPDPDDPGSDIKSCADLGNGEWANSLPGATDESGCYKVCEAYDVINGTAEPVSDKAFWPNDCEYEGKSETGNPCDIIDGVCVETSCIGGYEMIDGECEPCNREGAQGYLPTGICQIESCVSGYHPNGDQCEEDVQECSVPNAIYAEKVWDYKLKAYSDCLVRECEYGFHIASNACVSDVQPCDVDNGAGFKEWDHDLNKWGECEASVCDPGYTSDPSMTNERTKQCGRCKNAYSIDGDLAATDFRRECEIASCLYQGERFDLQNNECVPICPTEEYSDDTGTMKWNPTTKKCERTCFDGYTMW